MRERKEVTYKHLKVGQEILGWSREGCSTSASSIVSAINPAFVTVKMWGTNAEKIPSEGSMFEIWMPEVEFQAKYMDGAIEIMKALNNNKLLDYEIGEHEMWNGWVKYDPFEMAQACAKHKIKVLGICDNVWQSGRSDKDLGVCAEYEDGEKFWCHAEEAFILRMFGNYNHLLGNTAKCGDCGATVVLGYPQYYNDKDTEICAACHVKRGGVIEAEDDECYYQ